MLKLWSKLETEDFKVEHNGFPSTSRWLWCEWIPSSIRIGQTYRATLKAYVCPNRMDCGIHSDHSYLEVLEKPLCSTLSSLSLGSPIGIHWIIKSRSTSSARLFDTQTPWTDNDFSLLFQSWEWWRVDRRTDATKYIFSLALPKLWSTMEGISWL